METPLGINLIASNPEIRSGRPYLIGTTVTVADVAILAVYHQRTPDEIAEDYDLTLAQVYAALAYYYDHKAEMDEQIRQQIRRAEDLKAKRVGNERSLLML